MTTFTDDFDRADGSPGANWVQVSGTWTIVSNRLSSGNAGGTIILRAAGAMSTNDNSAQVTISTTAAVSHGVWCRGNANITSGYLWRNDGSSWNLFSVVGGSFSSIGSFAGAAVNGDVAKVQAVGSTIKGYVNGVQRVSVTDTNVTTGTSVGIRAESVSALRFDDFTAADVTSGVAGDAAFSGTATLTTSGVRATAGSAALSPTVGLAATGTRTALGAAGLAASAVLAADGSVTHPGDSALAATAALVTAGLVVHPGDAMLTGTAVLTAAGMRDAQADTGFTVTTSLAAQGEVAHSADAALSATATFTAAGNTAGAAQGTLTATLTAHGTVNGSTDTDDVDVGAPYSPWAAGQPHGAAWSAQAPTAGNWEVGAPC